MPVPKPISRPTKLETLGVLLLFPFQRTGSLLPLLDSFLLTSVLDETFFLCEDILILLNRGYGPLLCCPCPFVRLYPQLLAPQEWGLELIYPLFHSE